jgi:hypothetical protein
MAVSMVVLGLVSLVVLALVLGLPSERQGRHGEGYRTQRSEMSS